jgi:hypothetical protein
MRYLSIDVHDWIPLQTLTVLRRRRTASAAAIALRGGQRDIHDRRVEHDHELCESDDPQDQPSALRRGGAGPGGRFAGQASAG